MTRGRWKPGRPYDELPELRPIGELLTPRVRTAEERAAAALRAARDATAPEQARRIVRNAGPLMEGWASSWIEQVYADPGEMVLKAGGATGGNWDLASATGCAQATVEAWEPDAAGPRWPSTEAAARAASLAKLADMRVRNGGVGIYRLGEVVYTPPRGGTGLRHHLQRLWDWIERWGPASPLVAAAAAHYQFEAIHPFADGNGRAGRVLISAMLRAYAGAERGACAPSVAIRRRMGDYYEGLTAVTAEEAWEEWILYMLDRIAAGADYVRSNVEIAAARGRRSAAAAGGDAEYAAIVEMATAQAHVTSRDVVDAGLAATTRKALKALRRAAAAGLLKEGVQPSGAWFGHPAGLADWVTSAGDR